MFFLDVRPILRSRTIFCQVYPSLSSTALPHHAVGPRHRIPRSDPAIRNPIRLYIYEICVCIECVTLHVVHAYRGMCVLLEVIFLNYVSTLNVELHIFRTMMRFLILFNGNCFKMRARGARNFVGHYHISALYWTAIQRITLETIAQPHSCPSYSLTFTSRRFLLRFFLLLHLILFLIIFLTLILLILLLSFF